MGLVYVCPLGGLPICRPYGTCLCGFPVRGTYVASLWDLFMWFPCEGHLCGVPMGLVLGAFDDGGDAHAAADAEGDQSDS